MANAICPDGPYFGFTEAELLAELDRLKAARKTAGGRISSFAVNGTSTSFSAVRSDWDLETWQWNLKAALYLIDSEKYERPLLRDSLNVR